MTDEELESLLIDVESDRSERKASISDGKKIRQAICAFANDMPGHRAPGVVFVGANDDGSCANLSITDELLRTLAGMRSDVLPLPSMIVQKKNLHGCELAVVIVHPSDSPPVRFDGRTWIRVGPRRATASAEEERRLSERRRARDLPFDLRPQAAATVNDLNLDIFRSEYLPSAIARDVLEENERSVEEQLASLRFVGLEAPPRPTVLGLLVIGKTPADFVPGGYCQFLRVDGRELSDPIADQKDIHGPIPAMMRRLDEIFEANIRVATDLQSASQEIRRPNYPVMALQQLARNAVMHRDYESSNAPVRITWFTDRIEIQNPGGPFGQVTIQNFGQAGLTDYRNPHLAEAMKTLGYVQRFGVGIQIARRALHDNGNPPLEFSVQPNHVLATVKERT